MRSKWTSVGAGFVVVLLVFFIGPPTGGSDAAYDWLVAKAAIGSDAYASVGTLAEQFEVSDLIGGGSDRESSHPRTPGALLLMVPLGMLPFEVVGPLYWGLSVCCLLLTVGVLVRGVSSSTLKVSAYLVALFCVPALGSLAFGAQSAMIAFLVWAAWGRLWNRGAVVGSLLLAAAITLKLFPGMLLVPLVLAGLWRSALLTTALLTALNVGGLALPGVSLSGAVESISNAQSTWIGLSSNASLVKLLLGWGLAPGSAQVAALLVVIGILAAAALSRREAALIDPTPWLLGSLLVIPLSWFHYDLVLLAFVVGLLLLSVRKTTLWTWLLLALWMAPVMLFAPASLGWWFLVARVVAFGTWWWYSNPRFGHKLDSLWLGVDQNEEDLVRARLSLWSRLQIGRPVVRI